MSEKFENLNNEQDHPAQNDQNDILVPRERSSEVSPITEEIVSRETGQEVLEGEEQEEMLSVIAKGIGSTPEELINGGAKIEEEARSWLDGHPKIRKGLQIFTLSTALAGAMGASDKAEAGGLDQVFQGVITAVVQGDLQHTNMQGQQQIYQQQVRGSREIQEQQARSYADQNHQNLLFRQEMERENFAHQRAMRNITNPDERAQAELEYRQQRELKTEEHNQYNQAQQRRGQYNAQERQMELQRENSHRQVDANVENVIRSNTANSVLQRILMGR